MVAVPTRCSLRHSSVELRIVTVCPHCTSVIAYLQDLHDALLIGSPACNLADDAAHQLSALTDSLARQQRARGEEVATRRDQHAPTAAPQQQLHHGAVGKRAAWMDSSRCSAEQAAGKPAPGRDAASRDDCSSARKERAAPSEQAAAAHIASRVGRG